MFAKRLALTVMTGIVLIFGIIFSVQSGPLIEYRGYQPTPLFSVVSMQYSDDETAILMQVRNNELNASSGYAWYETNTMPQSATAIFGPIASKSEGRVVLPVNEPVDLARITPQFEERIAYLDDFQPTPRPRIQPALISEDAMRIDDLTVEPLDDEQTDNATHRLMAQLALTNENESDQVFRYLLGVIRVVDDDNAALGNYNIIETVYRNDFTTTPIDAQTTVTPEVAFDLELNPGLYIVMMWVQVAEPNDIYRHYQQYTYPDTIRVTS